MRVDVENAARRFGAAGRPVRWGIIPPLIAKLVDGPDLTLEERPESQHGSAVSLGGRWVAWKARDPLLRTSPEDTDLMLDAFLLLPDADDAQVLGFVNLYGALMLCRHLLPSAHDPSGCHPMGGPQTRDEFLLQEWRDENLRPEFLEWLRSEGIPEWGELDPRLVPCCPLGLPGDFDLWEPIEAIRHFARQFRAILAAAVRFYDEGQVQSSDWETIAEWADSAYHLPDQEAARAIGWGDYGPSDLARIVSILLAADPVYETFTWSGERREFEYWGSTFATLAHQLADVIVRGEAHVCSYCDKPFVRQRRPQAGRQRYCPDHVNKRQTAYKQRDRAGLTPRKQQGSPRSSARTSGTRKGAQRGKATRQ